MVAEPGPPRIQGDHERAGLLQLLQHPLPAAAPGQQVGQLAADPLGHRGAQQQPPDLLALPFQHLGQQVVGHRPLAAGKLFGEPLRVRVPGKRQRGQAQPGRPALGPLVQRRQHRVRQLDPGCLEQRPRLGQGEPQIGGADLGELALQPQPVQPQPQVMSGGKHEPQPVRRAHHQQLQLAQRLGGGQLVHVVDHQPDPVLQPRQVFEQPLDDCPAIQVRRGGQRPHQRGSGRGRPQRVGHRDPEPLRITLLALHRHPGGAPGQDSLADPRPQQERLPAPGRRRHLSDARCSAEPSEQRVAGYHPANGRGDRSVGGPGPDGRLHGTPLDRPRCLL